jgi:ubiquinone/menaquinone biosynthesis C-methylase UbiE
MTGLPAAQVFDALGKDYEKAFIGLAAQREEAEWLAGELPAGAKVVDLGCGTGRPVAEVLAAAGHEVSGYDVSPKMVEIARAQVPTARFEVGDLRSLSFPAGSLHAIVACFSLLQLPRPEVDASLARFAGWLSPGGYLLLGTVAADVENLDIVFMGQPVTVSSYPLEGYRTLLADTGLEVVRERVARFQPDYPGSEADDNLFLTARKA